MFVHLEQVDEDLAAQLAAMKTKSQMEIDAAVVRAAEPTAAPFHSFLPPRLLGRGEALLSAVRVSRVRPPQKHADAAVEGLIAGMPSWVDAAKVEAEYLKAKAKAPTPTFPSPYYPAAAAEATVTAANMKLLHAAYAKAS